MGRGEPLGHAHVAWERTRLGVPEIGDVWVLQRRGQGIGSGLTRAAERLAAARGHDRVSLSVSLDGRSVDSGAPGSS